MRFLTREQLDRAREKMRAIVAASLPKTSATISFTDGMPSMAPTDGNRALLATLDQVSRTSAPGRSSCTTRRSGERATSRSSRRRCRGSMGSAAGAISTTRPASGPISTRC